MAEVFAVTGVGNDLPGDRVDLLAGDARLGGGNGALLGLQHHVVHLFHLVRSKSHRHGAGHVGAVALIGSTEVHGDEITGLNHPLAGNAVRQAGVGAGNHDGIKSQSGAAVLVHTVDQFRLELQLGHAGLDPGQNLGECLVGDGLGLQHQIQLPGFLGTAETVDLLIEGNQLGVQILLIAHQFRHGEIIFFISQSADTKVGDGVVQPGKVAIELVDPQHLKALDVVLGGFNVAAVSKIPAPILGHNGNALGNVELCAVVTAVAGSEQQAVNLAVQQRKVLFQIFHW